MIYLLLPVFNESSGIETVLCNISHQLSGQQHLLSIVNDGSTDATFEILKRLSCQDRTRLNLKIINHEKNLGLGVAMKTGINYISSIINDNDILITMDADNTHPTDLFSKLLENINNGDDIVIASRYAVGGCEMGLTNIRKILSGGASTLLKLFFPIRNVKDYTSGYRAYSGKIIKKSKEYYGENLVAEAGFTCMAEILIKLSRINAIITEVGLVLRYDLKTGKSKMKILKTIFSYLKMIIRMKLEKH
ncbi:MAG: glycosyltransferase family 2 protein [Elusimicrobiota bacterium]